MNRLFTDFAGRGAFGCSRSGRRVALAVLPCGECNGAKPQWACPSPNPPLPVRTLSAPKQGGVWAGLLGSARCQVEGLLTPQAATCRADKLRRLRQCAVRGLARTVPGRPPPCLIRFYIPDCHRCAARWISILSSEPGSRCRIRPAVPNAPRCLFLRGPIIPRPIDRGRFIVDEFPMTATPWGRVRCSASLRRRARCGVWGRPGCVGGR